MANTTIMRKASARIVISWDERLPWDIESVRHWIETNLSILNRVSVAVIEIKEKK